MEQNSKKSYNYIPYIAMRYSYKEEDIRGLRV